MKEVFVYVVEGTLYQCFKENAEAKLTLEEWDALDRSQRYVIVNGRVELYRYERPPLVNIPQAPLPLDILFSQGDAGLQQQVEALWDLVVKQERTKVDQLIQRRKDIEADHKRLTEEYEAKK